MQVSAKQAAVPLKDRYLTIRLPADVEKILRQQAAAETRSLAAQVLHYVKKGLSEVPQKK